MIILFPHEAKQKPPFKAGFRQNKNLKVHPLFFLDFTLDFIIN
jgi:hypothetical protein